MAIRVTQHTMYNNMVGHMQSNLGAYMESIQQGSSQKKINRPSDDPAGTYRVLTTRNDMVGTEQYQENVDTAKGWLNLADSILSTNVATAITGLKALAEQASTGTYTAGQRQIMADQARQYFGQLLNLSNTQFEDMHIFGGHKYDQPAFQQGLAATSWDENWDTAIKNGDLSFDGATERTVLVQFTSSGKLSDTEPPVSFRWSNDGGETWNEDGNTITPATDDDGNPITDAEGKQIYNFNLNGSGVAMTVKGDLDVTAAVTADGPGAKNGTMLYIRPTAQYMGDDKDKPVDVTLMGAGGIKNLADTDQPNPVIATGSFGKNVLVRIDGSQSVDETTGKAIPGSDWNQPVDLATQGNEFHWSYSTDGGVTWVTAKGKTPGENSLRLPVPGGYVDFNLNELDSKGEETGVQINGGKLPAGMQANIHPSRADLDYEIMKDTYLSVNSVGKDVFGGYYEGKPVSIGNNPSNNLFEVVGEFIGYLEGNNQEGCQKTLAALENAEKTILAEATRIGGMENRVEMAADVLSFQKLDQQERLSYTEDIDLTELMTKLMRQQLTYQTVLQSSSMIMQLSLAKYV